MKTKLFLLGLFTSLLFAACSSNDNDPVVIPQIPSTEAEIKTALQKKWNINNADSEYKTIVFKSNNTYNVESADGEITKDNYSIEAEIRSVVMSGFGVIVLTKLTNDQLEFNLFPIGEERGKSYTCTPSNTEKALKFLYGVYNNDNGNEYLYICDENGENSTLVITEEYIETFTWYPDGTKVLFMNDIDDVAYLYSVNVDGTGKVSVPAPHGIERFVIAPDGETLVYVDSKNIFTTGLDGNNNKQLTTVGEHQSVGTIGLSVDGKKIVYTLFEGDKGSIHVMNIDGTGNQKIMENDENLYDAQFSPDSKSIVYTLGSKKIFVCDVNGNNEKLIYSSDGNYLSYPYWHPDGDLIYFSMDNRSAGGQITTALHSVDINGANLKKYDAKGWKFIPLTVAK